MEEESPNKIQQLGYADHLIELAQKNGVSSIKVSDGVVLLFSREGLQRILENMPESGIQMIFVTDKPKSAESA